MEKPSSPQRSKFRTIQDVERTALRVLRIGLLMFVSGLVLVIAMNPNTTGLMVAGMGVTVGVGGVAWLWYASEHRAETRLCSRCGRPNHVFREESYFKCLFCGHVVILKEN